MSNCARATTSRVRDLHTRRLAFSLQSLVIRYSQELSLSCQVISDGLLHLQSHSLEKLASKKKWEETGVAKLTIKYGSATNNHFRTKKAVSEIQHELNVKELGSRLKEDLSALISLPINRIKLIFRGRIIDDTLSLENQGVKHNSKILMICSTEDNDQQENSERAERLAKTRRAAELLSNYVDEDRQSENMSLQLTDQSGKPLKLPASEKKALVLAMALNEKGRTLLKKGNFSEALLILLQADEEFSKCDSDILSAVDNYALLCLDIVWCYLRIQNLDQLPDAESRLRRCDECFRRSYGPDLERLILFKGSQGNERALFMRLHLLQGIVAFHRKDYSLSKSLFNRANKEINELNIDPDKLSELVAMGFTAQESRLALRACGGSVSVAASNIVGRREERKRIKNEEKQQRENKELQKSLGKTKSGKNVDIENYKNLVSMGYCQGAACEALKRSDNELSSAIQIIQEDSSLLTLPNPEKQNKAFSEDSISQITALGFERTTALIALQNCGGRVQKAADALLQSEGEIPAHWLNLDTDSAKALSKSAKDSSSNPSSDSPTPGHSCSCSVTKRKKKEEEEALIRSEIISDVAKNEEDYLDLDLEADKQFLQEYLALLSSVDS